jgi:large subunit ribosomal protein L35
MPKLKTKSSTKKRFRVTGTGKITMAYACKRHMLRRRPKKMKRANRGTKTLAAGDASIVRSFMPYL